MKPVLSSVGKKGLTTRQATGRRRHATIDGWMDGWIGGGGRGGGR